MAFFDSDQAANNSKLTELKLLVDNKVEVYKKKDILYYEKDGVVVGVAGVLKEKNDGTISGKVIAVAVTETDKDRPIWDLSNFKYDAEKLEDQLRKDKLKKISETIFEKQDTIWGSPFHDQLFGYDGKDTVVGWQGNDRINGGKGKDTLTGDLDKKTGLAGYIGDDVFVFDQSLSSNNVDRITDFNSNHDSIELSRKIFKEFDKGTLKEDELHIGKSATGDDPQILYKASKGHLLYDPDGGGKKDAEKFATIGKNKDLHHDDFIVI
jgi:hypothetical protein